MAKQQTLHPVQVALNEIRRLENELAKDAPTLSPREARAARQEIGAVVERLERTRAKLDPIVEPASVFNPANPSTVGLFVSIALLAQDRQPLASVARFYGSGVYAIYYDGPFDAYQPVVGSEHPIYVGKADPATPDAKTPRQQDWRLARRVNEHAQTIREAAANLNIDDFNCRYLIVQSGLQTAAEDYLIDLFKPIWNKQIKIAYGIGKHGDDPETRKNLRSPWDTLHEGRDWAHRSGKIKDAKPLSQIKDEITKHYEKYPPFKTVGAVLKRFYEDLKQK